MSISHDPISRCFIASILACARASGVRDDFRDAARSYGKRRKESPVQQQIVPNLWFDTEAEEAASFYCSIFPNSRIVHVARYTEAGPREAGTVMVVEFELNGNRVVAINGGPEFTFSEAISLQVRCETQEEIDRYWERLTDGGEEGPCGWLKDRYGLSWQITPANLDELFAGDDAERSRRVAEAMFQMKKLDIAALRAAGESVPA
jgi:predicted 3-demethylubiquinone-9 3-methyltransferase (glyoxalase superfamily)